MILMLSSNNHSSQSVLFLFVGTAHPKRSTYGLRPLTGFSISLAFPTPRLSVCEISAMSGDPHPTDELPAEKLDTSEGPVADKPSVSTNGEVTPADDAEADDKELKLSVQQSATPNATANESETPSAVGAWFRGQPGVRWLKGSVGIESETPRTNLHSTDSESTVDDLAPVLYEVPPLTFCSLAAFAHCCGSALPQQDVG